jgi:uncharacterized membrane protein YfhO
MEGLLTPRKSALIEEPLEFTSQQLNAGATARVTHLSDERMEVETNSDTPAFLVTSDVFYPGWRATIDDVPARIFQTNYTFRGLPVPAGKQIVRFEFAPRSFYYGTALSVASILLLAATVFWIKRRERRSV